MQRIPEELPQKMYLEYELSDPVKNQNTTNFDPYEDQTKLSESIVKSNPLSNQVNSQSKMQN
jgi:hypothetical protein